MGEEKTPRKLRIDIPELIYAMENAEYEHKYYLDLEAGNILYVSGETSRQLEEIREEAADEKNNEDEFDLDPALKKLDPEDWQTGALLEAYEVEKGFGERYISIPQAESDEAYDDMEDFAETVEDQRIQDRFFRALNRSRPFRGFKDVLEDYPDEREQWFSFKENRTRERALEWLKEEGIEPVGG